MANDLFDLWGAMKVTSYRRVLADIDDIISKSQNMEESLQIGLDKISVVLRCEAYTFWIYQLSGNGMIRPLAFTGGSDISGIRLFPGEGIVGKVIETGEGLIIEDCQNNANFKKEVDKKSGFKTKSMICVPTKSNGVTYGCIQVINRKDDSLFDNEDYEMITSVANKFSEILEKYDVLKEYFGYDFEKIAQSNLKPEHRNVVAMVTDITGLHHLMEKGDSETLANSISVFMTLVNNVVSKYGGVINQSLNDHVEVVFNMDGKNNDPAYNMLLSAKEIVDNLDEFEAKILTRYNVDLNVNIYCNIGDAYCSYIGPRESAEYKALGSVTQSLASIRNAVNKKLYQNAIILTNPVYDEIRSRHMLHVERVRVDSNNDLPFDIYNLKSLD